ncbi:uncharacterized protein PG998_013601 [Apiospora kogelbergensis]|uniref:uncharacterized protein n=1 Tax=Apiospora kogelbergensis TaxID=1337665 RepID=UPI00312E7208
MQGTLVDAGASIGLVEDTTLALGAAFEEKDLDLFSLLLDKGVDLKELNISNTKSVTSYI